MKNCLMAGLHLLLDGQLPLLLIQKAQQKTNDHSAGINSKRFLCG
jgi:hypothetical protein